MTYYLNICIIKYLLVRNFDVYNNSSKLTRMTYLFQKMYTQINQFDIQSMSFELCDLVLCLDRVFN